MHTTHDEQQLSLRVHRMTREAEGVLSLELRPLDASLLPEWQPGAHLDLVLPGVLTRQYSLCGDPDDRSVWRIAVLREPVSKGGSEAVHQRVRPGDVVGVVGPRNNFVFREASSYRFVAGGIGITPLLPMIRRACEAEARWSLLYGGRSRTSMAFLDQLSAWDEQVLIRPQDECGVLDLSVLDEPEPETLVYCCGPEPLLAAVGEHCKAWPSGALHIERFKPKDATPADQETERSFHARLERSGCEITVEPGESILQAIEAAGLTADSSCREGICGTCETKVLAGQPDHRDSLLSEEEQAEGATMMICVGRAFGERIVLDL